MSQSWFNLRAACVVLFLAMCAPSCGCDGGGGEDVGDESDIGTEDAPEGDPARDQDTTDPLDMEAEEGSDAGQDDPAVEDEEIELPPYPRIDVTVDGATVTGTNLWSPGFQLDGPDIRHWDEQPDLRALAEGVGFKMVRFFEHRYGKACTAWDESTRTGTWDWSRTDRIVGSIVDMGAEPFVVLGFYSWTLDLISSAPEGMSSDPATGLPYPDQWGAYCAAWVRHFRDAGIPVRYYEIINEPYHYFGWPAEEQSLGYFMELFNAAATAMRAENPDILLGNDASIFKTVLERFISDGEPLDFISFHRYGLDDPALPDADAMEAAETRYLEDSLNIWSPDHAAQIYRDATGLDLPVLNTEGNFCDEPDPRTQQMAGAVYTALSLRAFLLKGLRSSVYFTFGGTEADIGMVNVDTGEPWYPFMVYQMIGPALSPGDELVEAASSSEDVRALAWRHEGRLAILLIVKVDQPLVITVTGAGETLDVQKIDTSIPWDSPAIQEGSATAASPLVTEGYAVALLKEP
jgi:hypothetical protein